MAETKVIDVSYPSGRELLNAYWGLLANGGLVIGNRDELREGDAVLMRVTLESSQQTHRLTGHVARISPHDLRGAGDRVVIAFAAGQPQDRLLDAAWAESENAPAPRRDRRIALDVDVRYHGPDARESRGRLVNVSQSGCCLRLPRQAATLVTASVGEALTLLGDAQAVPGVVRWAVGTCRGIEFQSADNGAIEKFVKQFL